MKEGNPREEELLGSDPPALLLVSNLGRSQWEQTNPKGRCQCRADAGQSQNCGYHRSRPFSLVLLSSEQVKEVRDRHHVLELFGLASKSASRRKRKRPCAQAILQNWVYAKPASLKKCPDMVCRGKARLTFFRGRRKDVTDLKFLCPYCVEFCDRHHLLCSKSRACAGHWVGTPALS